VNIAAGTKLGRYEIRSKLGEGGGRSLSGTIRSSSELMAVTPLDKHLRRSEAHEQISDPKRFVSGR